MCLVLLFLELLPVSVEEHHVKKERQHISDGVAVVEKKLDGVEYEQQVALQDLLRKYC